jgi:broad specificity polyphosphatase/5'/3'-nucleotidase SurE
MKRKIKEISQISLPRKKKTISCSIYTENQQQRTPQFQTILATLKNINKQAIRYLTNKMETYNLNVNNKVKEANTIQQILYNNKYHPSLLINLTPLADKNTKIDLNKTKWAKFTICW